MYLGVKLAGAVLACFLIMTAACDYEMSASEAPHAPEFANPGERRVWVIENYLPWMEGYDWTYYNVPPSDGRFLYELIQKTNRQSALEMGSANGYSAIWIGLAMEQNQGKLVTIELDQEKAALCKSNIKNVGLEKVVTCLQGDALLVTPRLDGRFDFLFVDIGPTDLLPFVQAAEQKLKSDFIIALHNIGFAGNYEKLFEYAKSKGWAIKSARTKNGEGFFLISPKANF